MIGLFSIALNPNIDAEQFNALAEEHFEQKKRQLDIIGETLAKLPPEQRMNYLSQAMQIFIAW